MTKKPIYSRIKDVGIPIYNYKYFHKPSGESKDDDDPNQIDRKNLTEAIFDLLNTKIFAGVYLVTGFRGSGKSSLVKKAILKFKRKRIVSQWLGKKFCVIETNLSGSTLNSFDVLKNITWSIYSKYSSLHWIKWERYVWLVTIALISYFGLSSVIDIGDYRVRFHSPQILTDSTKYGDVLRKLLEWDFAHRTPQKNNEKSDHTNEVKPSINDGKNIETSDSALANTAIDSGAAQVNVKDRENTENQTPKNDPEGESSLHIYLLLLLICSYVLVYYVMNTIANLMGFDPHHKRNLARLKRLNERISSNESDNQSAFRFMDLGITVNKKVNHKDLTEKEISFELEQIIVNAQKRRNPIRVCFIFIIDELDKLELVSESATAADQVKRKKDRIFQLLGELKQFFVNAKAKFFCITGAEMYDASLADITERDSYLGSIFHRVIYVPSFFSDFNNHSSDITRQTEKFLSQFLTPEKKCNNLQEFFGKYYPAHSPYNDVQYKTKLYFLLNSFVGYLAFRAKGSPKKIVSLFEENLIHRKALEREIARQENGLYLHDYWNGDIWGDLEHDYILLFDEFDQYKIGVTSTLNSPFLYSYSLFITNHSDKLIISSSFLWDHIHKYHRSAFSEHHLEYIHELITNTKEPETKKQLTFLLSILKRRCVREIRSGLFDFKFTTRLRNEIAFLSNVIQTESAVYNFTLDEASNLKRYYQSKLEEVRKKLNDSNEKNPFLTGFLARTIGDLHYYDQEFDQAVIFYEEAVSTFYNTSYADITSGELVNMMRWFLLLSLTYEKCGQYTKAFVICCDVNNRLKDLKNNLMIKNHNEIIMYSRLFHQNTIQRLMLIEKTGLNGIKLSDLNNAYAELALIYNGSYDDDTGNLKLTIRENRLIQSEIYHKINNLLFFRNTKDGEALLMHSEKGYAIVAQHYLLNIQRLLLKDEIEEEEKKEDLKITAGIEGLKTKIRQVLTHPELETFCDRDPNLNYAVACADYLSKAGNALIAASTSQGSNGSSEVHFLSNLREDWSTLLNTNVLGNDLWLGFALYNKSAEIYAKNGSKGESAEQYLKILYLIRNISSSRTVKYASQDVRNLVCVYCTRIIQKILKLNHDKDDSNSRIFLQKYKSVRGELNWKINFSGQLDANEWLALIRGFPNASDIGEALLVYLEVVFNMGIDTYTPLVVAYMDNVNHNTIIQSQFVRLMELSLKAQYNFKKLTTKLKNEGITDHSFFDEFKKVPLGSMTNDIYEEIYQLTNDSIYCLFEVLRIISVQRNDFMIGYSVSASMYGKLAKWITIRRALLYLSESGSGYEERSKRFEKQLEELIHRQNVAMTLSAKYNYEQALAHYERVEQTHKRGAPYKEFLYHMYVMEDDLNDEFTHFMLSLERMRLNRGGVEQSKEEIKKSLERIIRQETKDKDSVAIDIDWIFSPQDFLK